MTGQTADRDFIDRLDEVIGCQQCGGPLTQSVSNYFCSELCSMTYSASAASEVGYRYWDEDEHGWTAEALADLEPVSWIAPPVWRLPRSTGDLEADQQALNRACETVQTPAQQAACDLRQDDLDQRRRVANAKNWRLPRSTGNFWADDRACHEAAAMATTDAQRAACVLRREDLEARRPSAGMPGRRTSWGLDRFVFPPLRDLPIVTTEQAQRAANAILAANLPGIRPSTIRVGMYRPPFSTGPLRYELRRDSDDNLMATFAVPEGNSFQYDLPYGFDPSGCHWRILNSNGDEVARWAATTRRIVDSSFECVGPRIVPPPAQITPAIRTGDVISITTGDGTHRYEVTDVDGHRMTCRRVRDQSPSRAGAEITHTIVDETANFPSPQARALDARRNRNTGPAPRPGRIRGNVPGARR
jgi:hypothetical protein